MFDFIAENQDTLKTDFVTWTGDNSAHNVWNSNDQEVADYTLTITKMFKETLGSKGIQFYPALGNHDTFPVNVQDFEKPNSNFQINKFKESWTSDGWLTQE